jgi:hypothetical protein
MATTLMPLDPALSPQRISRVLTISANLLPDEIVAARRARRNRGWVIVAVALVVCLCAAWFAYAESVRQDADEELTAATVQVTDLQRAQRDYSEVVRVQNNTAVLTEQLKTVMANDLDWAAVLDMLRDTGASSGIEVAGVSGRLAGADGATAAAGTPLPSTTSVTAVGSLVVTGTGPDKKAVAAYIDALGKQSMVANPFVTSVTSNDDDNQVTFSLTLDISQTALCGRFGDKCEATGGN